MKTISIPLPRSARPAARVIALATVTSVFLMTTAARCNDNPTPGLFSLNDWMQRQAEEQRAQLYQQRLADLQREKTE